MAAHQFIEVAKSEFEYFSPTAIQSSVVKSSKREFTPISAIQHGSPIQFFIPGSDMLYMDLAKSYIYVRARVRTPANAAPANTVEVGPINNTLHSLFSNVEVELGGKNVSDSNPYYHYMAYFETLLNYGEDAQKSQLQSALWYKDTAAHMCEFSCAESGKNMGLVSRANIFKSGAEVEMIGPIHSDIFHQDKAIPANVPLKITFIPNRDNFILVTPAPTSSDAQIAYTMDIVEMKFYLHTLEVAPALALAHNQMLQKVNMRFPYRRLTMKHVSITTGQSAVSSDNIFIGEIPNKIVMALVTDSAMGGGYQQNPFNFDHCSLNYLALQVNGETIPSRPFQPNFASNQYIREYNEVFEGIGILFANKGISISRQEFANGYTIFIFDLTPDQNCSQSLTPSKTGAVRLQMKLAKPATETLNVLLLAEYDSWFEIDKFGNVINKN